MDSSIEETALKNNDQASIKETVWKNIDQARERFHYTKKELALRLGLTASTYSDCLKKPIDMRLSYAMEILAGVGLSFNDALWEQEFPEDKASNRFFSFLENIGLDYDSKDLPKDCLLREYDLKALLPTFYAAVDFCRDKRIVTIIQRCLVMSDRDLYHFFCTVMGSNSIEPMAKWMQEVPLKYDDLRAYDQLQDQGERRKWHHVHAPNVVERFWEGGICHAMKDNLGSPFVCKSGRPNIEAADIADYLETQDYSLSVGQVTKYLRNSRGESEKANSEPRLSRAVMISSKFDSDLDSMVEPLYSFEKWKTDIDTPAPFETDAFTRWYNRFYSRFRETFKSFVLLQVFIERFRVLGEEERDRMTSLAAGTSRF